MCLDKERSGTQLAINSPQVILYRSY